jgi:hypothetical protein
LVLRDIEEALTRLKLDEELHVTYLVMPMDLQMASGDKFREFFRRLHENRLSLGCAGD